MESGSALAAWMGRGNLLGIPKPVTMFAVAAALMASFLRLTRLGAFIYSVGDNLSAARATGIPTRPLIVLQYLVTALISLFAGIVMAASLESMPTRVFNSTLIYDVCWSSFWEASASLAGEAASPMWSLGRC